jgi:competence protein ComEA
VGAAVVAVLVLLAVGVALSALATARGATDAVGVTPTESPSSSRGMGPTSLSSAASGGVFVHILGRVARPGLYEVGPEARAIDVVSAAGGFADDADQASLNLARRVTDGEQIVIPRQGEAPVSKPATGEGGSAAGGEAGAGGGETTVDLNTADAALLESLPGVGPSTARAILDWRAEHGRFESIDDLLDVTGIGAKKLDKLRDRVRAG